MTEYSLEFSQQGLTCLDPGSDSSVVLLTKGDSIITGNPDDLRSLVNAMFETFTRKLHGLSDLQKISLQHLEESLMIAEPDSSIGSFIPSQGHSESDAASIEASLEQMTVKDKPGHPLLESSLVRNKTATLEQSQTAVFRTSQGQDLNLSCLLSDCDHMVAEEATALPAGQCEAAHRLSTSVAWDWYPVSPLKNNHILRLAGAISKQGLTVDKYDWLQLGRACALQDGDESAVKWYDSVVKKAVEAKRRT